MPVMIATMSIDQNKIEKSTLPAGIWGRVRKKLIEIYGEATDRNWFSKITANIDEGRKEIKLQAATNFCKDWIETNYFHTIEQVVNDKRFKISFY
jgi:chromosomal replication initiation ATPase DnaA